MWIPFVQDLTNDTSGDRIIHVAIMHCTINANNINADMVAILIIYIYTLWHSSICKRSTLAAPNNLYSLHPLLCNIICNYKVNYAGC